MFLFLWAPPAPAQPGVTELVDQAQAAISVGDTERALALSNQAVALAVQAGDPTLQGNALRRRAEVLRRFNRYDEAEAAFTQALSHLAPLEASVALGYTQHGIAQVHRYRGEYAIALSRLREAQETFGQLEYDPGLIDVFNSLGVVYDHLGELDRSLEWHSRSLTLSRKTGNETGIADGLYAIGHVHRQLKEFTQALAYFQDALRLDVATGDAQNIARSHMQVGTTYGALGNYETARAHVEDARDMFARIGSPRDVDWALGALAHFDVKQGNFDAAMPVLERVLEQATARGWSVLSVRALLDMARLESAGQRHGEAVRYAQEALATAKAHDTKRQVLMVYEELSRLYEAAGQPAAALAALRSYMRTKEALFDRRRTSVIAVMQSEAEFERQSIALELSEKEQALTDLALQRETTLRSVGLAALLGCFLLCFLVYGRIVAKGQNRRLALEVEEKTRKVRESHDELERAYAAVNHASLTDPLTGLSNRRFLEHHLATDTALAASGRDNPSARPNENDLIFFLIDLDHFKAINDREGHDAGDAVLVEVSRLLEREFRTSDYVVRWGGEEFLVVVRFVGRWEAPVIAERVRAAIARCEIPAAGGRTLHCTCSIGFAAYPLLPSQPTAVSWQEVVTLADSALYQVKRTHRDGWAGYTLATPRLALTKPIAQWVEPALRSGALQTISSTGGGVE
ncbi:MAG: diguanylate cyclase [Pseudomonadota bacterium]